MNTNWQKIKISNTDYFSIQLGGTPATGVVEYWNGDILWVTPIDLSKTDQPVINETIRNITESGSKNSSAKLLPKGSIVISTRAPIGYLGIAGRELAINQGCKALIIKKSDKTDSKFLYFLLLSKIKLIKSLGTGSTFLELSKSELGSIELNFPPKSTQQKIVKVLDTIQAEVGKQKEIIEKTKELKKSLMKKLFSEGTRGEKLKETEIGRMPMSWGVVKIKDFIIEAFGGGTPSTANDYFWNGEIPWVTSAIIKNEDVLISSGQKNITEKGLKNSSTNLVPAGNLLVGSRVGVGKAVVNSIDIAISQDLTALILNKTIIFPEYLAYLFKIDRIKNYLFGISRGTTIKGFSRNEFLELKLPVSKSLDEQKEIASILQKVDERIELVQKQKRLYEELFHTTLNKLMTGKIDVSPVIPAKAGIQD